MAPSTRRGGNWADASIAVEAKLPGVSARDGNHHREISLAHGVGADCAGKFAAFPGNDSVLQQLLGSSPSPARSIAAGFPGSRQPGGPHAPCSPPAHAPALLATPASPPPPPLLSALECNEMAGGMSYRERLRAGGRGAFQRAFDVGLVPKTMKQDNQWSQPEAQGMFPQQGNVQNGMMMPGMAGVDAQQMWNGAGQMQTNEYWVPMEQQQQQMQMQQYSYMQQQQQQVPMACNPEMMQMTPMAQQAQMPMLPQVPQVPQMAAMPQPAPMPQATTPLSSPMDGMMAMLQNQGDKDLMALQLRAAAECQNAYED